MKIAIAWLKNAEYHFHSICNSGALGPVERSALATAANTLCEVRHALIQEDLPDRQAYEELVSRIERLEQHVPTPHGDKANA